jgi:hypothetical protein
MAEPKKRALDIFHLMSEIDRKKYDIWDHLTDDQKKEFSPLVTMRWMAGTTDERQIVFLNEIVNLAVFNLPEHKEFMLKLLTVCSSGSTKRYSWINYKLTSAVKRKLAVQLVATHYNFSLKEAEDSVQLFSADELLELAEAQGWQKDDVKALKKELS